MSQYLPYTNNEFDNNFPIEKVLNTAVIGYIVAVDLKLKRNQKYCLSVQRIRNGLEEYSTFVTSGKRKNPEPH